MATPHSLHRVALGLGAALALAGCAATPEPLEVVDASKTIDLAEFAERSTDTLWSADELLDLPVRDADGEEIGEVENIVVGSDDRVRAMIVEVGGFLDIGGTHLRVPWSEVSADPATADLEYVGTDITESDYERYDAASTAPADEERREWRVDELLGDYVSLDDSSVRDYGVVRDVMFDGDRLESVVVNRSTRYGGGYYNYPYRGYSYGFDPGLDSYGLGYGASAIEGHGAFGSYTGVGGYGGIGAPL